MLSPRSSPSRVRSAAPQNGAPLTAPGRGESTLRLGRKSKNKRPPPASLHYLRKVQLALQCSLDKKSAIDLLLQRFLNSPTQDLGAKALQQLVQAIDVSEPFPRPTMHNLGQIEQSRLAQFQQLLSLQVAFAAFTGDSRDHRGTMLGQPGVLLCSELPGMLRFIATGHDAHSLRI